MIRATTHEGPFFNYTHPTTVSKEEQPQLYEAAKEALRNGDGIFIKSQKRWRAARGLSAKRVDIYPELKPQ